jgi:hypothetical protein
MFTVKKSMYSLVLMDDVVRAVDEEAYRLGTSRSNLINRILAEQFSCVTPEMHMQEIFSAVPDMLNTGFVIQPNRSGNMMTVRAALRYKYRPTVNYRVELDRIPDVYFGTLRVQIRTQNIQLINMFGDFISYWVENERNVLNMPYEAAVSPTVFTRRLINNSMRSDEETGKAICSYISLMHRSITSYFSGDSDYISCGNELRSLIKEKII